MKRAFSLLVLFALAAACSRQEPKPKSALAVPPAANPAQLDPYSDPYAAQPPMVRPEPVRSYPARAETPRTPVRRQPARVAAPVERQAPASAPPAIYGSETSVQQPAPQGMPAENNRMSRPEDYPEVPQSIPLPARAVTPREEPREQRLVIPEGTELTVRVLDRISSDYSRGDERFAAVLDHDVSQNGQIVLPARTEVTGRLVSVKESGRVSGRAEIVLELESINLNGQEYDVRTTQLTRQAESSAKSDAARVGGGAAIGAVIGAITGGKKGAAIGATVGAGGGTASVLTTRGKAVQIERESPLHFRLSSPLEVVIR